MVGRAVDPASRITPASTYADRMSVPGGATGTPRAASEDADVSAPPPRPFDRLRIATDRVPTKWFAAIGTGVFLMVSAAFGGLADAPEAPVATLDLGAPHTTEQITLEIQEVVVVDDLPELYLDLAPGHRVVAVLVHATNEWTEPQTATLLSSGIRDLLRLDIEGLADARPIEIVRVDDNTATPVLQPGLRTPLAFLWSVPADTVADGDDVTVQVFDETFSVGQVVWSARLWGDPVLAATVDATVEDLGGLEDEQ